MTRIEAQNLVLKANFLKDKIIQLDGTDFLVIDFKMLCITVEDSSSYHESCKVEAILVDLTGKIRRTIPLLEALQLFEK